MQLVLGTRVPVDGRDRGGRTALHRAADAGHPNVVRLLVAKGAEVNTEDKYGWTPLHVAARGRAEAVRPEVRSQQASYWSRVRFVPSEQHLRVVMVLLENGAETQARTKGGRTALDLAAECGHMEVVTLLLDRGAEVNKKSKWCHSPVHAAIGQGHVEVARLLLARGTDVDSKLLFGAAKLNAVEIIRLILAKGVGVGVKDRSTGREGWTALHYAALYGQAEVVKFLLVKKAEVDAMTNTGQTPLQIAAWTGRAGIADMLLSGGARVNAKGRMVRASPPNGYRLRREAPEIFVILVSAGGFKGEWTALHGACITGKLDVIKVLLGQGADVDVRGSGGLSALHCAAMSGSGEVIDLLLDEGAGVNEKDARGSTPLHYASRSGHKAAAEVLLKHGANVNCRAHPGITPLHWAVTRGHKDVAELLLANGADVNFRNHVGETPLDVAMSCGHKGIVDLLKHHGAKQ